MQRLFGGSLVVVLDVFGTGHDGNSYGIVEEDDHQLEKMLLLRWEHCNDSTVAVTVAG